MRRRKFLLGTGSAFLGGTSTIMSQRPSVALRFTVSGIPQVEPRNVTTIAIGFEDFRLTSSYIDDSQDAEVTISLKINDESPVTKSSQVNLVNGESTDVSNIQDATPVVKEGIRTANNVILGEIEITVTYPDISDTFRQTFSISSSNIAVQSIVAEDDLVGWWPLNEMSGDAVDYSGSNNDGSVNSVNQGVAGKQGLSAYSFNGNNSYIDSFGISSQSGDFSISIWIRPDNKTNDQRVLQLGGINDNSIHIADGSYGQISNNEIGFFDSSNTPSVSHPITYNTYQHIVITYDGDKSVMYFNGSDVDSSTSVNPSSWKSLTIGYDGSNNYYLDGCLQDMRIYDRAISDAEVSSIYQKGVGDFTDQSLHDGTDTGAVSRYDFNGNTDDIWSDNDGSRNGTSFIEDSIIGKALDTRGGGYWINCGQNFQYDDKEIFTVSFWYKADNNNVNDRILGFDTSGKRGGGFGFLLDGGYIDGGNSVSFRANNSQVDINPTSLENWYHVALSNDGSGNQKLYLNGERNTTSTLTWSSAQGDFIIGAVGTNSGVYNPQRESFRGIIDDVRIYKRALTDREIRQLYLYGTRGKDLRSYLQNINR